MVWNLFSQLTVKVRFNILIALRFLNGKFRVAQLKQMTSQNLELQVAAYGAQLANFDKEQHDIKFSKNIFWPDSINFLFWLRTPDRLHIKIEKRAELFQKIYNLPNDGNLGFSADKETSRY